MQSVIRCTRRVRDPLNYMIMQLTDAHQVRNKVRAMDNLILTWYIPLVNLQQTMHSRYVAEQFGEMILPPGVTPPKVISAVPSEEPRPTTQSSRVANSANNHATPNQSNATSVPHNTKQESKENSIWPDLHMTAPSAPQIHRQFANAQGNLDRNTWRNNSESKHKIAHASSQIQNNNNNNNKTSEYKYKEENNEEYQQEEELEEEKESSLPPLHWSDVENVTLPSGATRVPLGLVTLTIGNLYPCQLSRLEKWLDPPPHTTLSMRVTVMDRVFWQRTSWLCSSVCHSLCWGRFPALLYGLNVDYKNEVRITTDKRDCFSEREGKYTSPLKVEIPNLHFSLTVRDTGIGLFDPFRSPLTDGFADNESALHQLMLSREMNMRGLDGCVYRQSFYTTPCLPNLGEIMECEFGSLFTQHFNCNPVGAAPVACWLVREIPHVYYYQMEGEVEDENDPYTIGSVDNRGVIARVQKKAMNRYFNFRDELRNKVYSENAGMEMPRERVL